jgi:hypothetical protein
MSTQYKADVGSLCKEGNPATAGMLLEPGWLFMSRLGASIRGCAASRPRIGERSMQPGVQSVTYRTKGLFFEHGNPDLSARYAKPGKLPGPATSRAGGRASVVVRARESRVHGEGRQ